jgi:hypothetical protein
MAGPAYLAQEREMRALVNHKGDGIEAASNSDARKPALLSPLMPITRHDLPFLALEQSRIVRVPPQRALL